MKKFKLPLIGLLIAALLTIAFIGCKKDLKSPALTSDATLLLPTTTPTTCCVEDYSQTLTQLFSCGDETSGELNISAENTATSIIVHIERTGQLNANLDNRFSRVEYSIKLGSTVFCSGSTEGQTNSVKSTYDFTCDNGTSLIGCTQYQITITIKGLEGFDALPTEDCANEWPGNGQGVFQKTFTYTVKTICTTPPPTCTGIHTQTQGFWGSSPTGIKYLSNNFSQVGTITIGCASNTKTYSTASALTSAIKSGTATPVVLPILSTFSSQVLTLSINLKFWPNTANLVVTSGDFAGMTVQEVLDLANQVIGGCNTTYTPSQLNNIVDAINKSYDNGIDNGSGILTCPE